MTTYKNVSKRRVYKNGAWPPCRFSSYFVVYFDRQREDGSTSWCASGWFDTETDADDFIENNLMVAR